MASDSYTTKKWLYMVENTTLTTKSPSNIDLDSNPTSEDIVRVLTKTSGLPNAIWNPVNIYLHFTNDNSKLKHDVLVELGLDQFKSDEQDLLSVLYMITASNTWNSKLARVVCSQPKNTVINDLLYSTDYNWIDRRWVYPLAIIAYVTGILPSFERFDELEEPKSYVTLLNDRYSEIRKYSFDHIMVLVDFYSKNYDPATRKREIYLTHPYNRILYAGTRNYSEDKIEGYITEWISNPEDVIDLLNMKPSLVVTEDDYVWEAFGSYRDVVNRDKKRPITNKQTLLESTDGAIIDFVSKKDIHISFKYRSDLIKLGMKAL